MGYCIAKIFHCVKYSDTSYGHLEHGNVRHDCLASVQENHSYDGRKYFSGFLSGECRCGPYKRTTIEARGGGEILMAALGARTVGCNGLYLLHRCPAIILPSARSQRRVSLPPSGGIEVDLGFSRAGACGNPPRFRWIEVARESVNGAIDKAHCTLRSSGQPLAAADIRSHPAHCASPRANPPHLLSPPTNG